MIKFNFFTCLCEHDHLAWLVISCQQFVTEQADDGGRGQDTQETVSQLAAQCLQERVLVSSEVKAVIWLGVFDYELEGLEDSIRGEWGILGLRCYEGVEKKKGIIRKQRQK